MAARKIDTSALRAAFVAARAKHGLADNDERAEHLANEYAPAERPIVEPASFAGFMSLCESEPERLLLEQLLRVGEPWIDGADLYVLAADRSMCQVAPQYGVGRRRIDLAIFTETRSLAVEVDGWEVHYSTPVLADDTCSRSREVAGFGWTPIHFTGGEINRDVVRCVIELRALMSGPVLP